MTVDGAITDLMWLAYHGPVSADEVQAAVLRIVDLRAAAALGELGELLLADPPRGRCPWSDCGRRALPALAWPCAFRLCPGRMSRPKGAARTAAWVRKHFGGSDE